MHYNSLDLTIKFCRFGVPSGSKKNVFYPEKKRKKNLSTKGVIVLKCDACQRSLGGGRRGGGQKNTLIADANVTVTTWLLGNAGRPIRTPFRIRISLNQEKCVKNFFFGKRFFTKKDDFAKLKVLYTVSSRPQGTIKPRPQYSVPCTTHRDSINQSI